MNQIFQLLLECLVLYEYTKIRTCSSSVRFDRRKLSSLELFLWRPLGVTTSHTSCPPPPRLLLLAWHHLTLWSTQVTSWGLLLASPSPSQRLHSHQALPLLILFKSVPVKSCHDCCNYLGIDFPMFYLMSLWSVFHPVIRIIFPQNSSDHSTLLLKTPSPLTSLQGIGPYLSSLLYQAFRLTSGPTEFHGMSEMFSVFFFPQKLCKNYCLGLVHPLHQQAVSGELDRSAANCVHSLVACLHSITTGYSFTCCLIC